MEVRGPIDCHVFLVLREEGGNWNKLLLQKSSYLVLYLRLASLLHPSPSLLNLGLHKVQWPLFACGQNLCPLGQWGCPTSLYVSLSLSPCQFHVSCRWLSAKAITGKIPKATGSSCFRYPSICLSLPSSLSLSLCFM